MCLLTKSQNLGLTASNSLRFVHWRGPFASPGWVPQKAHDGRSDGLGKGLKESFIVGMEGGACPSAKKANPIKSLYKACESIIYREGFV